MMFAAALAAAVLFDGSWRGTSLCTDLKLAPACKDEQVIYDVTPSGEGKAHMKADKIVNGVREDMGDIDLVFHPASGSWRFAIGTRAEWRFTPKGTSLDGELIDIASGKRIRVVKATRQ